MRFEGNIPEPQHNQLMGGLSRTELEYNVHGVSDNVAAEFPRKMAEIRDALPTLVELSFDQPIDTLVDRQEPQQSDRQGKTATRPQAILAPPPSFGRQELPTGHEGQNSGAVHLPDRIESKIAEHSGSELAQGDRHHRGARGTIAQEMAGLFSSARGKHTVTSPPNTRKRSRAEIEQADLRYPDEWASRYTRGV